MSAELPSSDPLSHRLFFALWPHESLQRSIAQQMHSAVLASGGRAIAAANLHVTLVFLGQVVASRLAAAKACAAAARGTPAFRLAFHRVETWRRSRVLCLTADEPPALSQLVERLRFNLLSEQFEIQQQEFRPHITLARDVRQSGVNEPIAAVDWWVERFALVESRRGPAGSRYTTVADWGLSSSDEKEIARTRR